MFCTQWYLKMHAADCNTTVPPTNAALGNCGTTLRPGSTCKPLCKAGFTASGVSTCSSDSGQYSPTVCVAPTLSSCQDLLDSNPKATSGIYKLNVSTVGPTEVACEMQGGYGWTKVIVVDRNHRTHCNDGAVTPSDMITGKGGKFADTVINALVGADGILKAVGTSSKGVRTVYFKKKGGALQQSHSTP